jgi:hypothetical protein
VPNGGTVSPAVPFSKGLASLITLAIGAPSTLPEATTIQVSHDYDPNLPEASQTPTWTTLQDSTGVDVTAPPASKTRQYAFYAAAFRISAAAVAADRIFQATVAYNDS